MNRFKLKEYSLMAASFLITKEDYSQVVYTDIEPDVELRFDSEYAYIDLDNNGINDFIFLKTSEGYSFGSISTYTYRYRHGIWAGPASPSNLIAGQSIYHSGYGGATSFFPFGLEAGELINADLTFQNAGFQLMGSGFYQTEINASHWHYRFGLWVLQRDSDYVGVQFKGFDDCMHYGWIRCTTTDSTKRLILHDYAYESQCNQPIVAGDTISYIDVAEENKLDAVIYSFGNTIYVTLNEQYNDVQLSVTDITGKEIYSNQITEKFMDIPLNEPKGIYIVTIISGKNKYSKKVNIN